MTVEPGVYFIDAVLDPAMADEATSKFFVKYAQGVSGLERREVTRSTERK